MNARIHLGSMMTLVLLGFAVEGNAAQAPPTESLQQMQAACNRGEMAACVRAGRANEDGVGTAVNKAAALALYRRACEARDGDGCGLAGWMTFAGEGTAQDFEAGYALLEKGCDDLRSGESCFIMSVINLGSGSDELKALGRENLMAACANGYAPGCFDLGLSFYNGSNGFERDVAGAVVIWELEACGKGYARGCASAGFEFEHNEEINRNPVKAVGLYRQACDARDPVGCLYLGDAYAGGIGGLGKDPARAAQLRALACELESALCEQAAGSAAAAAPLAAFKVVRMQLGVDTFASVERDIRARGGEPLTGGSSPAAKAVISALTGDFGDAGPDIMAVNYHFDATGPNGRLTTVIIVRHRSVNADPAPYASLVAERRKVIERDVGPLQQQSPQESVAKAANGGVQVTLHADPGTGFLRESYRLGDPP